MHPRPPEKKPCEDSPSSPLTLVLWRRSGLWSPNKASRHSSCANCWMPPKNFSQDPFRGSGLRRRRPSIQPDSAKGPTKTVENALGWPLRNASRSRAGRESPNHSPTVPRRAPDGSQGVGWRTVFRAAPAVARATPSLPWSLTNRSASSTPASFPPPRTECVASVGPMASASPSTAPWRPAGTRAASTRTVLAPARIWLREASPAWWRESASAFPDNPHRSGDNPPSFS